MGFSAVMSRPVTAETLRSQSMGNGLGCYLRIDSKDCATLRDYPTPIQ
jgi:hypothetical protein